MLYALNESLYGPPKSGKTLFTLNSIGKALAMAKAKKDSKKSGRNYTKGKGPRCGKCGKVGHYRVTCKAA